MKKAPIHNKYAVVTNCQAAEKAEPCVGSFDYPAPPIATQLPSVRIRSVLLISPVRCNQLHSQPLQSSSEGIAVICLIGDHPRRTLARPSPWSRNLDLVERGFCQRSFVFGCSFQENSERNTLAINHNHPLGTLAPLGFSHGQAPFFAGAKLPSINVSSHCSSPRRSKSPSRVRQICSKAPCSSHCCKRRQQVTPLGYVLGTSRQDAPLRNTHRMPSKQARLLAQGRPRPSRRRLSFGKSGSNFFHCWSVIMSNSRNYYPFPSKCLL
jgi:hypothetical protein